MYNILANKGNNLKVADQIRLWEDERKRLTFTEATLYSAFEGDPEFIGEFMCATMSSLTCSSSFWFSAVLYASLQVCVIFPYGKVYCYGRTVTKSS